jgi:hypothetical protein
LFFFRVFHSKIHSDYSIYNLSLSKNSREYSSGTIQTTFTAKRAFLFMVAETTFLGDELKTPFELRHFQIERLQFTYNGKDHRLEMDFMKNYCGSAYYTTTSSLPVFNKSTFLTTTNFQDDTSTSTSCFPSNF